MDEHQIVLQLHPIWKFQTDSHFDFEWTGNSTFLVTEVAPDLTVRKRIRGYLHKHGGIISSEEAELTLVQAKVFASVVPDFIEKLNRAEEQGIQDFFLMRDGDHTELFPSLNSAR